MTVWARRILSSSLIATSTILHLSGDYIIQLLQAACHQTRLLDSAMQITHRKNTYIHKIAKINCTRAVHADLLAYDVHLIWLIKCRSSSFALTPRATWLGQVISAYMGVIEVTCTLTERTCTADCPMHTKTYYI